MRKKEVIRLSNWIKQLIFPRYFIGGFVGGLCLLGILVFGSQRENPTFFDFLFEKLGWSTLSHLNVNALDLPFIINEVDQLGDDEVQLNWKEIVAILGVTTQNKVQTITVKDLKEVSDWFWIEDELKTFDEVVEAQSWKDSQKKRAYRYLEDLTYVGYVPEKLKPEAPETQFIEQLIEPAKQNYFQSGILPSITIAQAILESNWGNSSLTQVANNLFGIKVGVGWEGDYHLSRTLEYHDIWIEDAFRKYDTWQASVDDHANFLLENPRYQKAGVFEAKTYRTQAQALQDAGYSTAQDEDGNFVYAQRLGELIRQYNLQLIDHEVYLTLFNS